MQARPSPLAGLDPVRPGAEPDALPLGDLELRFNSVANEELWRLRAVCWVLLATGAVVRPLLSPSSVLDRPSKLWLEAFLLIGAVVGLVIVAPNHQYPGIQVGKPNSLQRFPALWNHLERFAGRRDRTAPGPNTGGVIENISLGLLLPTLLFQLPASPMLVAAQVLVWSVTAAAAVTQALMHAGWARTDYALWQRHGYPVFALCWTVGWVLAGHWRTSPAGWAAIILMTLPYEYLSVVSLARRVGLELQGQVVAAQAATHAAEDKLREQIHHAAVERGEAEHRARLAQERRGQHRTFQALLHAGYKQIARQLEKAIVTAYGRDANVVDAEHTPLQLTPEQINAFGWQVVAASQAMNLEQDFLQSLDESNLWSDASSQSLKAGWWPATIAAIKMRTAASGRQLAIETIGADRCETVADTYQLILRIALLDLWSNAQFHSGVSQEQDIRIKATFDVDDEGVGTISLTIVDGGDWPRTGPGSFEERRSVPGSSLNRMWELIRSRPGWTNRFEMEETSAGNQIVWQLQTHKQLVRRTSHSLCTRSTR